MIFSIFENFIFFSTIFALAAFFPAYWLKTAAESKWLRISPLTLTRVYAVAVLLPPVISLWLVLAALLPKILLGTEEFYSAHPAPVHELHLFGDITHNFEPFLAIGTLLLILTILFGAVWKSARGYLRLRKILECLEIPTVAPTHEQLNIIEAFSSRYKLKIGIVSSRKPFTFVWGFWDTKLIISSGLLDVLSVEELRGVIEHEAAHHTRRDNFFKSALSAASCFSLAFPLTRLVLRWQAEQIEFICDEIAAAKSGAPLDIASALVKLSRNPAANFTEMSWTAAFFSRREKTVEKRVKRLIFLDDILPEMKNIYRLEKLPKTEFSAAAFVFCTTLFAVLSLAPLDVHRATEFLFQTIK